MRQLTVILVIVNLAFLAPAHALYETMTTGDLVEPEMYEAGGSLQFISSGESGINGTARIDGGISEDSNFRGEIGFGKTDFSLAAYYKWVPIPDVDGQPAIGFLGGISYARYEAVNELSLRLHPFTSKRFFTDIGTFNTFLALPFGFRSIEGETDVPIQLVLGTEHETPKIEHVRFLGEIGFNMKNAFSYVSFGVKFILDEDHSFQFN